MSRYDFRGKVVWLTGASTGIGAALTAELARAGAVVAVSARRRELLEEIAKPLVDEGHRLWVAAGDLSEKSVVHELATQIVRELGPIDCLIMNAGINTPHSTAKFESRALEAIIKVNLYSGAYCVEEVLPAMLARGSGYLVGVASLAGYRALPKSPFYGASKAALIYMLESMRFPLEPKGIKVTVVNPGFVATPMIANADYPTPWKVSAEDAAKVMMKGLRNQKREIAFPWQMRTLLGTLRLLPGWLYHAMVAGSVKE